MKFEWDENKNDSNIKRYGIDIKDARKATKNEQKKYFKQVPH